MSIKKSSVNDVQAIMKLVHQAQLILKTMVLTNGRMVIQRMKISILILIRDIAMFCFKIILWLLCILLLKTIHVIKILMVNG